VFATKKNLIAMGVLGVLGAGAAAATAQPAPTLALGAHGPKVAVLEKEGSQLNQSIATTLRRQKARAQHREASRQATGSTATGVASPESYGVSQATLDAIASCESGGDPSAVSAGGVYRGLYQFDQATWESVGGSGDPAAASPAEQSMRAAMLYSQSGSSPWPVCGQ
jgi:soluble lytic murein transglycosylase-like protein